MVSMPYLHPVQSSSIEAVGYDESARHLFVRFVDSGETYVYHDVEPSRYEALLARTRRAST
jgi:hypothetical protein